VGMAFMTKNNIAPVISLLNFLLINGYLGLILSPLLLREVLRDLHVSSRDLKIKVLRLVQSSRLRSKTIMVLFFDDFD
jgi:hypothetical protein